MSSSDIVITHGEKSSWPELVGKPVELAKAIIHRDRPEVEIVVIDVGQPAIQAGPSVFHNGLRPHRVRVYVKTLTKPHNTEAEKPDTEIVGLPVGTEDLKHNSKLEIVVLPVPHVV